VRLKLLPAAAPPFVRGPARACAGRSGAPSALGFLRRGSRLAGAAAPRRVRRPYIWTTSAARAALSAGVGPAPEARARAPRPAGYPTKTLEEYRAHETLDQPRVLADDLPSARLRARATPGAHQLRLANLQEYCHVMYAYADKARKERKGADVTVITADDLCNGGTRENPHPPRKPPDGYEDGADGVPVALVYAPSVSRPHPDTTPWALKRAAARPHDDPKRCYDSDLLGSRPSLEGVLESAPDRGAGPRRGGGRCRPWCRLSSSVVRIY